FGDRFGFQLAVALNDIENVTVNGSGFDGIKDGVSGRSGLGLRNMQERMAHFRGLLLINSSENGTTLTAMLPKSVNRPSDRQGEAAR
ncbi:hypothetical protein ACC687_39525, partial [Rhizobium ruizarguesonis]